MTVDSRSDLPSADLRSLDCSEGKQNGTSVAAESQQRLDSGAARQTLPGRGMFGARLGAAG